VLWHRSTQQLTGEYEHNPVPWQDATWGFLKLPTDNETDSPNSYNSGLETH
jgi:hypothetical protein